MQKDESVKTSTSTESARKTSHSSPEESPSAVQSSTADKTASTTSSRTSKPKATPTPYNAAHFSKGLAAASLTSTAMTPVTVNESALVNEEEFMFREIKARGYARIVTNH